MAIITLSSSYTQTNTSTNVTIPFDRTVLIVATDTNSAPTFNSISLTASTSYAADYYWWRLVNPPIGVYSLAAVGNNIINYFVLDNVDQTTPLSTQININSTTLNYNGTVYNVTGDGSSPNPTWFGVVNLDYPGGPVMSALSMTYGSILSNSYSLVNAATLTCPGISTSLSSATLNYFTNRSTPGAFAAPSPAWIFLNNTDIIRGIPQMIII